MCRKKKTLIDNKKKDTDSPTVATDSVFITATLDTHEGQDVVIFDTSVVYLHTNIDKYVIMLL